MGEMKEVDSQVNSKECIVWNEEAIEIFKEKSSKLSDEYIEKAEDTVEKRWKDIKEIVNIAVTKKNIKIKKWKIGTKKWWNKECSKKKRKAKKAYYKWRNGSQNKEVYHKERKEWKEICKQSEKEWKKGKKMS